MPEWKDISSHSQSTKDRTPSTWELRLGSSVRLVVHRHMAAPGKWHLTCAPWYDCYQLRHEDVAEAQDRATILVRNRAIDLLANLRDFE